MYIRTKFAMILFILIIGVSVVLTVFYIQSKQTEEISVTTTKALFAIKAVEKLVYDLSQLATTSNKDIIFASYSKDSKKAEQLFNEIKNNKTLYSMRENSEIGAFFYVMLDNWKRVPQLMAEVEEKYAAYRKSAKLSLTIPFSEAAQNQNYKSEVFDTYSSILRLSSYLRDKVIYNSDIIREELRKNMQNTIKSGTMISFAVAVASSLLVIILIMILSNRVVSRLKDFGNYADSLSIGDFSYHMDIKTHDEFAELSFKFNHLVIGLRKNIDAVLDFTRTVGLKLQEELDINQLYSIIATSLHKNTHASASAVCIVQGSYLIPVAIDGLFPAPFLAEEVTVEGDYIDDPFLLFHIAKIPLSHPLFSRALSGEEVFIKEEKTFNGEKISSLAIFPLKISRRVLGVICTVTDASTPPLTDLDVVHLKTFTDYTAVTLDNYTKYQQILVQQKIKQDMLVAKEIQQELLPPGYVKTSSCTICTLYRPLWEISGDYFDIITLRDKSTLVILCDVAGKGISASLVMVMIRTILRLVASSSKTPAEI
ncbi:SpoIIE family protein phosphatase, partial [Spirochaetia bacterium 38H-sp]